MYRWSAPGGIRLRSLGIETAKTISQTNYPAMIDTNYKLINILTHSVNATPPCSVGKVGVMRVFFGLVVRVRFIWSPDVQLWLARCIMHAIYFSTRTSLQLFCGKHCDKLCSATLGTLGSCTRRDNAVPMERLALRETHTPLTGRHTHG